jgi:hypothetical protein
MQLNFEIVNELPPLPTTPITETIPVVETDFNEEQSE